MLTVEEAQSRVLQGLVPAASELVCLEHAVGRVLAADVVSNMTHPPCDLSAMDGYAIRNEDVQALPACLTLVGVSAAGSRYLGSVLRGQAVRIFTGAPIPQGADTIVVQERAVLSGTEVFVSEGAAFVAGRHVRRAGLDFQAGERLLKCGSRLTSRDVALAAAMNHSKLLCVRSPRVALLATGNELVHPGSEVPQDHIVSSSPYGVMADITVWGGSPTNLGIARDDNTDIRERIRGARDFDIVVTLGGASVGDFDLVQSALGEELKVDFWKVAMRPGKPLIFGKYDGVSFLGLPGNPVSAFVCALLFLKPMIFRMLGDPSLPWRFIDATTNSPLPTNDERQEYLRCKLAYTNAGQVVASPVHTQDSSMLSLLSRSDGLIVRPPLDNAKNASDVVKVLTF